MGLILDYSFFAAYQCIELYLKSFLKSKNIVPRYDHDLFLLLQDCRDNASSNDDFIYSTEIYTIIYRFMPYYSMPRYPITKEKVKSIGAAIPHDIFILDYFVMRFRQMLPMPDVDNDILKETGLYITTCKRYSPNLYNKFKERNINFPERPISDRSFFCD